MEVQNSQEQVKIRKESWNDCLKMKREKQEQEATAAITVWFAGRMRRAFTDTQSVNVPESGGRDDHEHTLCRT